MSELNIGGNNIVEEEDVGLTLPMSRIKKIVKLDPEHVSSTESANYVIGLATEMFLKQLTADTKMVTKSKGRKKLMYTDVQSTVSNDERYIFMRDIVPKTAPIGELVRKGIVKIQAQDADKIEREESLNEEDDGDEIEADDINIDAD